MLRRDRHEDEAGTSRMSRQTRLPPEHIVDKKIDLLDDSPISFMVINYFGHKL